MSTARTMAGNGPRNEKGEQQGTTHVMDVDERPRRRKMRWERPRGRSVETHGEEGTQKIRSHGRRVVKLGEWYINNRKGRGILERGKSAQNQLTNSRQEKPVDSNLGAAARKIASKDGVGLAASEGGKEHVRAEKESKHGAAGSAKDVDKRKRKRQERRFRAQRKNFEAREAKRQERAQLEKDASTLPEQVAMYGDATTSVGVEKDEEAVEEDDFDIDIYGDEETRRKYGKRRRVA